MNQIEVLISAIVAILITLYVTKDIKTRGIKLSIIMMIVYLYIFFILLFMLFIFKGGC